MTLSGSSLGAVLRNPDTRQRCAAHQAPPRLAGSPSMTSETGRPPRVDLRQGAIAFGAA